MLYKINISDNSFIIADDNYRLSIFYLAKKVNISIKELFDNLHKYKNYYLFDIINNKKIKRTFLIEKIENQEDSLTKIPIGSRIKLAKDIQVNDLVVGPDGSPRTINELHFGEEEMYEIEVNGNTYTVNGGHILELIDTESGEHIEMPVNIYIHMDDNFKSHVVMEACEI